MRIGRTGRFFKGRPRRPPAKLLFCSSSRSAEPPETGSFTPSGAAPASTHWSSTHRGTLRAPALARIGLPQLAGNSSSVTGGAWARRAGNGSARNPRCSRIFFATSGSSMQAMIRIGPRQREHFRTSTPRPASAARPNPDDTSTAPTSTSAMTGAGTSATLGSEPTLAPTAAVMKDAARHVATLLQGLGHHVESCSNQLFPRVSGG